MALPVPPASMLDAAALFLDFDGTLVELADTPGDIQVRPELPPLLRRLSERLQGRVAIISGRAIADLERHLDCAGLGVSGSHGLELRLASGVLIPLAARSAVDAVRDEVHLFANAVPELLVEEKPASIAVHFRQAPDEAFRVEQFLSKLALRHDLALQAGKMVLELRPKGADKGDALRAFMTEPPFAGARPIFVGDDMTDEDAFEAAAALGGAGILVGPARPTAAQWRLANVDAVAAWLRGGAG
jgi:trehalose 6-phosphate phosphatase